MKIGICDDEILHIKINGKYVQEYAKKHNLDLELVGFTSLEQLFSYLLTQNLDILLLDIDMGGKSGIQAAAKLFVSKPDLLIIFITGHREFAYEAFDVDALGYVLKPIDVSKLERSLDKAIHQLTAAALKDPCEAFLIVSQENEKKKIYHHDIFYITREQARSVITTTTGTYHLYESITSLCEKLSSHFIRISQSEIVNLKEILTIKGSHVIMKNNVEKSISRSYKKEVLKAYFSL